ncbi:MAG: Cna B-type domain-containing protein, partial [Clostridia bacterium]|nr:Cna B-type domain-containing protein [Clostridia bacterium]
TYTEVGEYTYTISEQESSNEGVTIDETVYSVTVTVTDDLEGHLVAEISGIEADGTGANFVNEYEAADVDVQFSGSKTLDGKDLLDSEFTFDLKDADGNVLQSKTNDAKGTIIFDTITYTEVGEYTYTISEEASSNKGVTIDETVYNVTVTVTDDLEGHLVAEITGLNEDGTGANFTNFYHATGTTEEFKVSKVLEGKELVEGQFEFVLLDTDGNEIGRVSNDAKGAVTFDGISYDETDAGKTYSYTITEINAGEAGYTYDDMAVEVTVEVVDNGDGTLSTTVTYSDDKEFNNVYETVEINVQKVWDDNDDQDAIRPDSIEVVLYANGEQLETATLNEENSWSYIWKDLVKHSGGEDKAIIDYTIEEVKVDNYDSSMEATSDKDGNIEIVITNTHKVETTDIKVVKIWDDSDNEYEKRPDSVKVQLYANDKAIGDVIVLDETANWAYTWTDLDKNKAGEEIKYTVKEIDVSDSYIDLYSVGKDGTLIVTNQLVGEGGWEDEEPEPPYTGENPNTGANLFDSIELYIALIFGTIVVAAVVTKRTLRK